ncbi:MAG: radical SAM protein [Acidobacteriales bacterium]|nr:radical SAM protein [Terriglobales bacterium]
MASLIGKVRLLASLMWGEDTRRGPLYVNVDLVSRCNNVCLGCFYHSEGASGIAAGEMPFELVTRLARELSGLGVAGVIMAGQGEPLLHPRFFDVIATFKQAGLRTQVFTNGLLLDDPTVQRIVSSGIDVLRVSLWAITGTEHERWHPGIDARMCGKRLDGFRALAKACRDPRGPEVWLQMPINRENLGGLDRRIDFVIESDAKAAGFGYYRAYGSPLDYLSLRPEDLTTVRAAFKPALARLKAAGVRHDAEVFFERVRLGLDALAVPCYAPWYACSIRVTGDVLICPRCPEPLGNLNASSLADIWRGAGYRAVRRKAMRQTSSQGGWQDCACANCCWPRENLNVQRIFRWFQPVSRWQIG